jgi:uncharacterized protein
MSDSLRDQLLKAGLATKKQAAQAERTQQQQKHQRGKLGKAQRDGGAPQTPDVAQAAKAARDRELNSAQQAKIEARARRAQLRQLIDQHRLPKPESDEYFNFIDAGKVRRIPVDAALRTRLAAGTLAIVRCDGRYELVTPEASALVRQRDPGAVVVLESKTDPAAGEDDPYRDFVVPDDLTW